jgi:hypothetical protein
MKAFTALVTAALAAMLLVACGGGSSDSDSGSSDPSSSGGNQQTELRECLEEQGVELPEGAGPGQGNGPPQGGQPPADGEFPPLGEGPPNGQGGAPGMDNEELRKALEECGASPRGGQPNQNGGQFRQSIQKYVRCVRRNGYDLPDANLSGDGAVFDEDEVDQDDPKFQAASRKCQSTLRPQGTDSGSGDDGS